MAYDFHYTPTCTGVISGKEVLEQTEDAINDLGNTAISGVQEALDKAEQALTNSENAVDDAQTALNTANNAEGVAIQAQTDVGNLSGTVANIGNRVTTAEGNISNLQGRMTTAEGNITNIQGRMTTAESDIGNLQTAVSTAQATANSAQQTATTARQQSYVFRYSGTAITDNSTIAYSTIDNTDNIKAGDKILDVDGKLFEITAVDTTNETVTVGSALIDLAKDSDVVHTSGNETVGGNKIFTGQNEILRSGGDHKLKITDTRVTPLDPTGSITSSITWQDSTGRLLGTVANVYNSSGNSIMQLYARSFNANDEYESHRLRVISNKGGNSYADIDVNFLPFSNNRISLGSSTLRWNEVYATNYYYGSSNVEFSTKFVTTDTAQTISGNKTFSSNVNVYNSDSTGNVSNLVLKNSKAEVGTEFSEQSINFVDKNNNPLAKISCYGSSGSYTRLYITASDSNNNSEGIFIRKSTTGIAILPTIASTVWIGNSTSPFYNVHTKRINGLTPSSLSLPSGTIADQVDISGYFTNTGSGATNSYTALFNGWIYLYVTACRTLTAYVQNGSDTLYSDYKEKSSDGQIRIMLPVQANNKFTTQWTTSTTVSIVKAVFIPCQGNI